MVATTRSNAPNTEYESGALPPSFLPASQHDRKFDLELDHELNGQGVATVELILDLTNQWTDS